VSFIADALSLATGSELPPPLDVVDEPPLLLVELPVLLLLDDPHAVSVSMAAIAATEQRARPLRRKPDLALDSLGTEVLLLDAGNDLCCPGLDGLEGR
jgi:hypothetical protein